LASKSLVSVAGTEAASRLGAPARLEGKSEATVSTIEPPFRPLLLSGGFCANCPAPPATAASTFCCGATPVTSLLRYSSSGGVFGPVRFSFAIGSRSCKACPPVVWDISALASTLVASDSCRTPFSSASLAPCQRLRRAASHAESCCTGDDTAALVAGSAPRVGALILQFAQCGEALRQHSIAPYLVGVECEMQSDFSTRNIQGAPATRSRNVGQDWRSFHARGSGRLWSSWSSAHCLCLPSVRCEC